MPELTFQLRNTLFAIGLQRKEEACQWSESESDVFRKRKLITIKCRNRIFTTAFICFGVAFTN